MVVGRTRMQDKGLILNRPEYSIPFAIMDSIANSTSSAYLFGLALDSSNAVAATLAIAIFMILVSTVCLPFSESDIYELGGFSILTAWPFFTKRYDFLRDNFRKTGQRMFRFHVLQHRIVALSGELGRNVFFNDQSLDFSEGYRILTGAVPQLRDIEIVSDDEKKNILLKRVLYLFRKERVVNLLPPLFDDVQRRMSDWGREGSIDPFKEVYELVFQMTVHLVTCRELSEDKESIAKLAKHYWDLEKSVTPFSLLLPWFPGRAKKARKDATMNLYTLISGYVDLRRNSPHPTSDAIDVLIAEGDSNETIVGFVLGAVFAGVINTGMTVCWALVNLGMHLDWKEKVSTEVQALVSNHTDTLSSETLHKRLSTIPMNAWEDEMPVLDSVIRETLRLVINNTLLRRNLTRDIVIDGVTLERGDFLAYQASDVHANPEVYPNPEAFDPGRYDIGREEDKKVPMAFLAWGAGRHPCPGMRVAKLEMKIVIALIFAGYEFEIVDKTGKRPIALPQPDKNDLQQARPLGEPCYMKFRRIVD
ncbi:Lanosterol 14-alpha demethylase [Hypsizygus marmoreus]|uniref:Lanosterol 14-alpha demethylase n=1 Tax=Hypsizygus marmoreus TaxID=39966 RepID=A0A369JX07_HYPMA|nr:Lanosterol 14-alpha demethylase [Hypsizygus marmoreus]